MFLTSAVTMASLLLIILWSIGVKTLDASLLSVLIIVLAATIKIAYPSWSETARPATDE